MFLIPFTYKKIENIYPVELIHVFLRKGTLFLQMEQHQIDDFCNDNCLYFNKKTIVNEMCFLEIDTNKTNMAEFYTYYENCEDECWRRFLLIGNYTEDFLHINETNPEFIKPILENIIRFKTNCV